MLDLDLQVDAGAFRLQVREALSADGCTGVFGPSGSGKTTLLRAIAGFAAASGRIRFGDETWLDSATGRVMPPHRRRIGYVFQRGALFPHLGVRANLEYPLRHLAGPSSIRFDRVVAALDLADLLPRSTQGLSGGETQRVALGRALLSSPRLLLLDEPLSALDAQRKVEILPFLRRIKAEFAVPMLHVTHNVGELVQLADRVLVLVAGAVQAHGETARVLERLDVQSATGRFEGGSVIGVRVARHEPSRFLTVLALGQQEITVPLQSQLVPGESIRLRVRARDVAIATHRPAGISIRNIVPVAVVEIEPVADSAHAEVLLSVAGEHLRARITRDAVTDLGLVTGMPVFALIKSVAFDPGDEAVW